MRSARLKQISEERVFSARRLKRDWPLYLMMLAPVLLVFIFNYIPLFGIIISFQKFLPAEGFFKSRWIGFSNFQTIFTMPGFFLALRNTLIFAVWKIVLGIIVPVTFTLLLNEITSSVVKRGVQTLIYLPHFISWILLAGIFRRLLSSTGPVNTLINTLGGSKISFLGSNEWFPFTIIATHIWKEFGYGTIVYLAAVSGVNQDLYEAAAIDGAGHWKQLIHVTLPSIAPIIVLMSVLSLGGILNGDFDQVFNMYNTVVYESGDILETLVYRIAFGTGQFGLSAAASLFKSVVSCLLVICSYRIAYRTTGYRVF